MVDKLMYIQNDDTQNYPICRIQLVVKTFGNSNIEVVKPTNKKTIHKTLGTNVIKSLMTPPPPWDKYSKKE